MTRLKTREILAYIAIKKEGDWDAIMDFINHYKEESIDEKEAFALLSELKSNYITMADDDYPICLKNIYHPPFVLFYYGDRELFKHCQAFDTVAVIGSRENSDYGAMMTRKIVAGVAKRFPIVSGLARGIDAIASETAIAAGGRTIAVLGSGIDYCYPSENYSLYQKIKNGHLLVSEYPNKVVPSPDKFPLRNRIIAGLSNTVVVTEAGNVSGTSITVTLALQSGRTIMCVPYPADKNSACNRLIKEGAFLVESAEDIFESMSQY